MRILATSFNQNRSFFTHPKRILFLVLSSSILASFMMVSMNDVFATEGINQTINFQGKVANADGTNVTDGNYDFVFRLYKVSSAGVVQWTETWNSGTAQVAVDDGVFRVALGTHSSIASLDFNDDSWYMSVEFNGDGEMSPRIRFTSVPYAMNAKKVAGLTVTDTTGTFTLADGKTFVVNNGLTFSGTDSTTFTFPSTSGNVVTEAFAQTLTNKTIGSTGLTFSGATTDITTGTDEDLRIDANGTGGLVISDSSITLSSFTGNNAVLLATATTGVLSSATTSTDGLCLVSDGGGVDIAGWDTCPGGSGGSNWTLNASAGTLSPINNTLDILFGGSASTSAKFAFLNMAGGNPTASISAGTDGGAYLSSSGTLATTAMQTLNVGNSTTGTVNINSGSTLGINVITGEGSSISSGALSLASGNTTSGTSGVVSLKSGNSSGASGEITQVGSAKEGNGTSGVTLRNIVFDSTPQDDDIILLMVAAADYGVPSPPAGFTELYFASNTGGGSGTTVAAWYRRASSEASATYTITYSEANYRESVMGVVFRGVVNSDNPFEVISSISNDYTATPVAPSITTLTDNAWHLSYFWMSEQNLTSTSAPSGYANIIRTASHGQLLAFKEITPTGSTGTTTITGPGTNYTASVSLSLKPGVTPGGSGAITIASGNSLGNITGGALNLNTGTTDTGTSGNINIITGAATGAGTSGNLVLDVGTTSGGTVGNISIGATSATALILGRSGQGITLPGFDCSALGNGGKLTTTSGGVLVCDDDTSGSGSQTPWTSDIDGENYSLLDLGANITSRNGLTLGTGSNGAITLTPNGTGDTVISGDADSNIQMTFGAAPGVDMAVLSNAGFGTTTDDVNGLRIDFVTAAVAGTRTNAGLEINVTSGATEGSDILYGVNIENITGQTGVESGIRIGTGWDRGLVIESGGSTNSGLVYSGAGRPTKTITISPEYSGAVLTAFYGAGTDTNITGSMTSDADTTQGTSIRNYYQWERTTDATQHFYTVAVRVKLPADFDAWATTDALTVSYITESATTTLSDVDVRVYNENDATIVASGLDNASVSWTTASIDDSVLDDGVSSEWDAAGETAVIYLRMGSASSNYVRIGDIVLSYLAKF